MRIPGLLVLNDYRVCLTTASATDKNSSVAYRSIRRLQDNLTQECQEAGDVHAGRHAHAGNPYTAGFYRTYASTVTPAVKPWAKDLFVKRRTTCQSFSTHIGYNCTLSPKHMAAFDGLPSTTIVWHRGSFLGC